ncbi:MAG: hypothetical protein QXL50_02750 [Candidatus Pacearchaeota archaeon]
MKKYFIFIALVIFLITQLTFAATERSKFMFHRRATSTTSTPAFLQKNKAYNTCVGEKVRALTREMQNRKKQALSKFKEGYKNATTTEAKREVKKTYNQEIKEINKWFNQELRRIKTECKQLRVPTSTPTTTQTTTTSTQQ